MDRYPGIIVGIGSSNEGQRYIVTSSLIGWAHTHNDPWIPDDFPHMLQAQYTHWYWSSLVREATLKGMCKYTTRVHQNSFHSKQNNTFVGIFDRVCYNLSKHTVAFCISVKKTKTGHKVLQMAIASSLQPTKTSVKWTPLLTPSGELCSWYIDWSKCVNKCVAGLLI